MRRVYACLSAAAFDYHQNQLSRRDRAIVLASWQRHHCHLPRGRGVRRLCSPPAEPMQHFHQYTGITLISPHFSVSSSRVRKLVSQLGPHWASSSLLFCPPFSKRLYHLSLYNYSQWSTESLTFCFLDHGPP